MNNYNLLFRMTDSEYFKWAAHDDLLGPGLLEACVDVLDRDAAVVLASALMVAGGLRPGTSHRMLRGPLH
jgi:GT2 family glycosyltransferase